MQLVFGDFVLDPDRRELSRGTARIAAGPQVFDLLLYLVQNRERVVSKDELLDVVWAGRIVSESTLASHINAVRKAIGDSGEEQRLLRTVARKGFRFLGDIREIPSSEPAHSVKTDADNSRETLALPNRPSLAVLPFQNMSGDQEQEYFADGMVEEIITALSRIPWLFVIARNSSFTYKGRAIDVKQIGRELGVRYVLEGSVRKVGNRVRIAGQLIDAITGAHLWADRFDDSFEDVFELQDKVASSVALLNLMVNARDAMPHGGPIVVAARSETIGEGQPLAAGSYVCLSVSDSGEGMDDATLARATDPFFTTKEVGKGTGLGLPMVHGLAQESGGALVLKSQRGQGTTAELWFPVAEKSPIATTVDAAPAARTTAILRNLTVLVVDDDPLVLTNMAAMLEDLGHTVHEASSAREALAILGREHAIDLVLTDQAMPQMTGAELIEEIKSRRPKLPIILATGFAELPPSIDPLQQVTLAKPFLQYDLQQAVDAALEDPKTRRVVRFRAR